MARARAPRRQGSTHAVLGAVRAPFPGFVEPCLANAAATVPARGEWIHEIKHNGYRAQAHLVDGAVKIFTRNGYDWTDRFRVIAESMQQLSARQLVLDGEIVVTDEQGVSGFLF